MRALEALPLRSDPNVLVGTETGDDAAAYPLKDHTAVVATLAFLSPVADAPFDFVRSAAANSFSDVYAMGARPIFALNILCFPVATLGHEVLARVLAGGDSVAAEAGVPILGGHSVDDPEPKFGMVVTGLVHPDRLLRNTGARPGDVLFLTKPLGSGVLTTALKKGRLDDAGARRVVEVMATLNRAAAEAMAQVGVHACTDVTGFGLLGHLKGMVARTGVGVVVHDGAVPFLDGVHATIEAGICPGGTRRNLAYFSRWCRFADDLDETRRLALADAQTSGGLLIACPADRADTLESALREAGAPVVARIGAFRDDPEARIEVVR